MKRLPAQAVLLKWEELERCAATTDEREVQRYVRADHEQTREDVTRLGKMLRSLERCKRIPGYGNCCPICEEEQHTATCAMALLLSKVGQ